MQFSLEQFRLVHQAIENAFDREELDRLLLERFGFGLQSITGDKGFAYQVTNVTRYFHNRHTVEELLAALRDARSRDPVFASISDQMQLTQISLSNLEVFVRENATDFQDVSDFRVQLLQCEHAVCRIETPTAFGSGVLIGKNRVLTSFHVIKDQVDSQGQIGNHCVCTFDHKQLSTIAVTPERKVSVGRLLAYSDIDTNDKVPEAVSADHDKLDYALLELIEEVALQPVVQGGEARGHVSISVGETIPVVHTPLVILQHPKAAPMKIDFGTVTSIAGCRLRHSVSTLGGSSGAPVFDSQLRLVAIHQGGFGAPTVVTPYNQSIPLALIIAHAARRQVTI